jgi:hypothetical protein
VSYDLNTAADNNYSTAGTYYFNRYAKDATCSNAAYLAAAGTYTLVVSPPVTLCSKCCYTSSSTVSPADCYVTTNAYPFTSTATTRSWIGGGLDYVSTANSPFDGRANTNELKNFRSTSGAVGICLSLGDGWYLPAYEELENMSAGSHASYYPYSGCHATGNCPNLLATPADYYWSSTEYTSNKGRYSGSAQTSAVRVGTAGRLTTGGKTSTNYVRCAWRP